MTKGIAAARYLQIISLRDSKLDTQSCLNILLTLPRGVEELDLSFNPEIGLEVYQKLGRILDGNDDKMLKNLLFCHGREAYRRNCYLIMYMFNEDLIQTYPYI